ncbi:MAG TPA: GIY-YIG nuclease family protein [Bradyrhizobium sp.]|uniref:GIY-YIG nuclease family protein n=1 Tax=Bradyrhizobium sp. TaxID=376 RepID=UPI002C834B68|nr:GIY-YIG nuclease family protein [Bradyrhizobium sp.]HLZ06271.1 GIY-YIG nuclease family protein [Bradyrhizobium sp.]
MLFNNLLAEQNIDPASVLVLRHTPKPEDGELRENLPLLADERPEIFNAYQSTQTKKVEAKMLRAKYVASFIGLEKRKNSTEQAAVFVGLYEIGDRRPLTYKQFWEEPAYQQLKEYGMQGFVEGSRSFVLWFDLTLVNFYEKWKGKLIIEWPRPAVTWSRFASNAQFPIASILEDSALHKPMPDWKDFIRTSAQLRTLPRAWRERLSQWRGIYYLFDRKDGKGYVGSAYGEENILGRWEYYAASGHGGNVHLRGRSPENFEFSILELVSQSLDKNAVIDLENSWKDRLHTRLPFGLNGN